MFVHKLGIEVETRVQKLKGVVVARSEDLYGCNKYFVEPKASKEGRARWVDEDDITYGSKGIQISKKIKNPGGPVSKWR